MNFEKLKSLSIEQKVGQLFFIGLPGPVINSETEKLLADISPGGVCLFARNIKERRQTRDLLDGIREMFPVAPLLSLDQEGGLVDRLKRILSPMPAPYKIRNKEQAAHFASLIAEAMRTLGFNMDFAPVVDVIDAQRAAASNGLYSRNLGTAAEETTRFAGVFIRELQRGGLIGCPKHFPGLGASKIDSHEDLPLVEIGEAEFDSIDLLPYRSIFAGGEAFAVMVAHAAYPKLGLQETDQNGKLLPSSLSFNIVTILLRQQLGFDGLVLTDDLEMGAILKHYGIAEACVRAIEAGEDMLSICAGVDSIYTGYEAVLNAVENGRISTDRIDESLRRIAEIKSHLSPPLPFDEARLSGISDEIESFSSSLN